MNYNTKDIFLERATATQTFEEYKLAAQPNSVVVTDAYGNLVMVATSSFVPFPESASYAVSASYAPSSGGSFNGTASVLLNSSASIDGTGFAQVGALDVKYVIVHDGFFQTTANVPVTLYGPVTANNLTGSLNGNADTATSASWAPVVTDIEVPYGAIFTLSNPNDGGAAGPTPAGTIDFKCNEFTGSNNLRSVVSITATKDERRPDGGAGGKLVISIENPSGGKDNRMILDAYGNIVLSGSVIAGPNLNTGFGGFVGDFTGSLQSLSVVTGSGAPVDAVTVKAWMPVQFAGQTYYMPLYQ